jgi:hypothetical protein
MVDYQLPKKNIKGLKGGGDEDAPVNVKVSDPTVV